MKGQNPPAAGRTALPADAWEPFRQAGIPQNFDRGQMIYLQGQEPTYLYYLWEGRVRSFIASDTGNERVLAVYHSGSIFGESSFFDGLPRVSSAIALTACRIVAVDRAAVTKVFAGNPELPMHMLQYLAGTVRLLSDHVDHMSFLPASARIQQLLLQTAGPDGCVHMSQDEIAVSVGVSRVTVNRCLRELADAGLIRTGYGGLQLLDLEGLEACGQTEPSD